MSDLQVKLKLTTGSRKDRAKIDGLPRIGQYAVEKIRQNVIDKKITATGRTQRAINYRITGEKGLLIYAKSGDRAPVSTLQWGRPAGGIPPVARIKEWIKAKRITYKSIAYKRKKSANWAPKYTPQERGLNSVAWAIAFKIKKMGTDRNKKPEPEVYSPVLDEVIELFSAYIVTQTEKTIVAKLLK